MAEEKISELTELTSPADGDFLAIVDVSDTTDAASGTTKKIQKSNLSATIADASTTVKGKVELATDAETLTGTDTERAITPANLEYARSKTGWIPSSDTWTYASGTTFTIAGADRTSIFTKGTKLKLTNSTVKYFYVVSSAFSTNTTVTVTGGSDYSLADAAISSPYYSCVENPQGFPAYFNWSPTFTGFSANPTGTYKFLVKGTLCFVEVQQTADGTSNAATFYISAPVAASIDNGSVLSIWSYAKDNSSALTAPGMVSYLTSGQNFRIDKTMAAADGWTTSGGKRVRFTLSYLI